MGRDTKSSHQIVVENSALTKCDKLNNIIRKSLPIINSSQPIVLLSVMLQF
jgi:hypothetical protein